MCSNYLIYWFYVDFKNEPNFKNDKNPSIVQCIHCFYRNQIIKIKLDIQGKAFRLKLSKKNSALLFYTTFKDNRYMHLYSYLKLKSYKY